MPKKLTIEDMHNIALKRNGKFISNNYINSQTNYKWQCDDGHSWIATANNIQKGKWCPYCVGLAKLTIEDMHQIAENSGGKFLSTEYINTNTKYNWKCDKNHEWESTPRGMNKGKWCPYCFRDSKKLEIKDMHDFAKQNNGKFISLKYMGCMQKHKWQCEEGHMWEAMPNNIQQGSWCPYCTAFRSEEICRKIISQIFKEKFIKCRPNFLPGKGRNFELDGYSEKLKIAFEYHGIQHYKPIKYFGGKEKFIEIQKYDKIKADLCKIAGINLIIVPTFPVNFDKSMCKYIVEKAIITTGIEIPRT